MPYLTKIMYADAHCHTNPITGLGAEKIGEKFKERGGWFIALVSLPPYHYGFTDFSIDSYRRTIELLINEKKKFREKGIETVLLTGFHPAEIDYYYREGKSLEEIISLAEKVFKLIIEYYSKGFIEGIGEVGRQHYSTSPARYVASELVMVKALEYARDHDLFVHLHLEQGGIVTVESINYLVEKIGVKKNRVFMHHVDYSTGYWSEKHGFWHTIPAKKRDLEKGLSGNRRYVLVESDFIDDPSRPGVSSYPWDIIDRVEELIDKEIVSEEYVYKIMVDHIVEAYGVEHP